MEALNDKSVNEHLLAKTRIRKMKLEAALSAVENPDYGLCKICRQPIPVGRLLMLPEADTCVDCAR
jgi:DnaK suppressor protein